MIPGCPHCTSNNFGCIEDIKSGDTVMFMDFWNPSISHYYLHSRINRLDVKFVAWFHGCSLTPGDYVQQFFEPSLISQIETLWMQMYDELWVTSEFFKIGWPLAAKKKARIVRDPYSHAKYEKYRATHTDKKYDICFAHRFSPDKIDEPVLEYLFDNLQDKRFAMLSPTAIPEKYKKWLEKFPELDVFEQLPTKEYLQIVADSRIFLSTAFQEGWGYSVMKAISLGCIPVLPNRAVYPELYSEKYIYDSKEVALEKIKYFVSTYPAETFIPQSFNLDEVRSLL
ncbi:MAG: hypothetical protein GKR95_01375 [Gammaproteobacteria bacterium]|nr:hypothetical protein [Gammaproteobacteria bacterium]